MSYCREEGKDGKDRVLFVTKEDLEAPIKEELQYLAEEDDEDAEGLILSNGDINWSCPCLGGMASGPCGNEFREAFSCFHYSTAELKGSNCIDNFRKMQECMTAYPILYPMNDDGGGPDMPQENEDSEPAAEPSGAVSGGSSADQQAGEPDSKENVS